MLFQIGCLVFGLSTIVSAYGSNSGGQRSHASSGDSFYGQQYTGEGPLNAAVRTNHRVEYYEVPNEGSVKPTMVEVDSPALPMTLLFKTHSSALNVVHRHEGQSGDSQETSSEDEPHLLKHTVKKPVIQELYEIIAPVRKITQEILPVEEEIQTIVARAIQEKNTNLGLGGSFGFVGKSLGDAIQNNEIKTFPVPIDTAPQQTDNFEPQKTVVSSPKSKVQQKQTY